MSKTFFRVLVPLFVASIIFAGVFYIRTLEEKDVGGMLFYTGSLVGVSFEYPSGWGQPTEQTIDDTAQLTFLYHDSKTTVVCTPLEDSLASLLETYTDRQEEKTLSIVGATEAVRFWQNDPNGFRFTLLAVKENTLYTLTMLAYNQQVGEASFGTITNSFAIVK